MSLTGNIGRMWLAGAALLALAPQAGQLAAITIEFAPPAAAQLEAYGSEEGTVLRKAVLAAVARETGRLATAPGLAARITVEDIAPTHPTRGQLADEPTLDAQRTTYLGGGAELLAEVRDANERPVATVSYRYFAPRLAEASSARDPWADAHRAIDEFAARLAAACRARAAG